MKRLHVLLAVVATLLGACDAPGPAQQADFAILANAVEGYADARPGHQLQFPRDHGSHEDYRIEWWYLTANLEDADGRQYGAQWTLFRVVSEPPGQAAEQSKPNPWNDPQIFMAHFAISWPDGHRSWQRYARGGVHQGEARAGVSSAPFAAWMDHWELASTGSEWLPMTVHASQDNCGLDLRLASEAGLVLQGLDGFSQKHPQGGGSFYYSHPFLQATGTLVIDGQAVPVQGQAWLDREWSSQFLQSDQSGWDWFSVHLDSGEKLMLFRLRQSAENNSGNYVHGVLISPDGGKRALTPASIRFEVVKETRVAGRNLPLHWRITLEELQRELTIQPLHPRQWMDLDFPYWEGVILATGNGPGSSGKGYLELTGYPVVAPR